MMSENDMTKAVVERVIDQGVHRFLADGVHYRDLMDLRSAIPDWKSWPGTWSKFGADTERRAENAFANGSRATARMEYARASLYNHYGQCVLYYVVRLKREV